LRAELDLSKIKITMTVCNSIFFGILNRLIYSDHFNDQEIHVRILYSPSAGTSTSFSSSSLLSEPSWCIDIRMSVPPTNSWPMYSWGIVCQSLYSLIPVILQSAKIFCLVSTAIASHRIASPHLSSDIPQHTSSKLLVLKHIERRELLRVDALEAEDLDRRTREAALRSLGSALHEQDHGRRSDGLVDC
jgi:hypothetical protein